MSDNLTQSAHNCPKCGTEMKYDDKEQLTFHCPECNSEYVGEKKDHGTVIISEK